MRVRRCVILSLGVKKSCDLLTLLLLITGVDVRHSDDRNRADVSPYIGYVSAAQARHARIAAGLGRLCVGLNRYNRAIRFSDFDRVGVWGV